ncbi:MAG: hypothetical protein HCA25_20010 [Dolichospermum sp. DET50]|nr:hypothetical protein [Dolichospermum sp. DET66]MBS3034481.1 hypothetical protein [Dolichospermum sp. DET67]MBS3039684.1 hypothetical protein [Dolichospermum sp. DET50]QSX66892.1 MAG: hypothetical protein EZY12_19280 [Dolichospermum sp. DET69]
MKPTEWKNFLVRFNGLLLYKSGDKAGAIKDLETAKQLFQQQGNTQNAQKVQKILNKL